ncbi:hypothetical protein EM20IM_00260 [Candidatus Methylacidiphilum infernorum]|uniref:RDD family protein n=1 Tax=Candidatus Methylacidiphilum infernorum TaxID=511746 RepID=A0ABX7PW75_9BACT|nr:hypothetical protein [Candidatus Methylacidiphilum infernorum]QSR86844.1 hypothetical protein EM20IM_00260 [Candidatus Methylacidiphilum infernorum]
MNKSLPSSQREKDKNPPLLIERWLIGSFEMAFLFSLCAKIFNRWLLLIIFPVIYFFWCVFWEWKTQSRPFHRVMGLKIGHEKLNLRCVLWRGVLRIFFPFACLGLFRVSLLDWLSRCRWEKVDSENRASWGNYSLRIYKKINGFLLRWIVSRKEFDR